MLFHWCTQIAATWPLCKQHLKELIKKPSPHTPAHLNCWTVGVKYSTVGCRRTVCRRTARLEIHLKIRTSPGCKNSLTTPKQRLLWRRLFRRHCWLRNDSTSTVWNISAAFHARHASSPTVCALQANQRDSKTDWKIRTRLAGVVKNKNDLGWDRLPHVLRHPTVL